LRIFHSAHSRLYYTSRYTNGRCAMWRMSDGQALIFVATIAIGVALLLA
jgi:hypothetical protein